ncbi:peptidase dimerization domain-containing protein [Actinacidiphila sp. ITFR-21]|uniref:peptidase dimerization domain-containing protein n=1 Tax=Actinacidiphila sp. ITFR-21 TaxID=3075199 RepID=UPI00288999EA|nr:peptidase dimerization domain-containing protein [Streptomyces sp. ITFR-21]WNI16814.1 peptidase dimerization domain-containing protein [Streptomyces sp. ITFR-21]
MLCHIAADLNERTPPPRGGPAVLLDVDEHTGVFGGAWAYLADPGLARPAGVMIGYPGLEEVVVGGRGLWRATLRVHTASGHPGSSRSVSGAVTRAARLVRLLDAVELPAAGGEQFPPAPRLSVTAVHGGEGFFVVADLCVLSVDVRTTPVSGAADAETAVRNAAAEPDAVLPGPRPTDVEPVAAYPPFRLRTQQEPAAALLRAAAAVGVPARAKTARPSNIGNLPAGEGTRPPRGSACPTWGCTASTNASAWPNAPRSTPPITTPSSTCSGSREGFPGAEDVAAGALPPGERVRAGVRWGVGRSRWATRRCRRACRPAAPGVGGARRRWGSRVAW